MTSQPALVNHVDFGLGREARAVDDDDGPGLVDLDAMVADGVDGQLAEDRVVRLGRRQVGHDRAVVEGVGPAVRAVDELVADHEITGLDRELERACRARRDDRLDAQRAQRPDVGPVVDLVRRDRVAPAMTWQERDVPAGDLREEDRVRWRAIGRVDLDLAHVVEERVEARTSDDPDLRRVRAVSHRSPPSLPRPSSRASTRRSHRRIGRF